jgi:translocation and assembly module TamB
MVQDNNDTQPAPAPAPVATRGHWATRWARRLATTLLLIAAGLGLLFVILDSAIGHRFVIDRIAQVTPGSGLRVKIGRIDGSLFGASTLRDVVLSDPHGRFMTVPEVELDWRPLSWLHSGLDIRTLVFHRGTLWRTPKMNPGDPNAPILPDFNIRIDRFALDDLTIAKGIVGDRRRIDVQARADIRNGRALVDVTGKLGGRDRLVLHLDSEPDRDRFELGGAYDAPRDGLLAGLSGLRREVHVRVAGRGRFADWHGFGWAQQDGKTMAAFLLDNRSGAYRLAGQVFPADLVKGTAAAAAGGKVSLVYQGTFAQSRAQGTAFAVTPTLRAMAQGGLDLSRNQAEAIRIKAQVLRPEKLLATPQVEGVALSGTLDGAFNDLAFEHLLTVRSLRSGNISAQGLRTAGTARWDGKALTLPLDVTAQVLRSGQAMVDPHLGGARLQGALVLRGNALSADPLALHLKGLDARLTLRGDIARGGYALAGPIVARGFAVPDVGTLDGTAKVLIKVGDRLPWSIQANAAGRLSRLSNATLANLAGGDVRFSGSARMGGTIPLTLRKVAVNAPKLTLTMDGQVGQDGTASVVGQGRSADYGPFTVDARMAKDGPHAQLVFASPLPAAGLKDVRVGISPIPDGLGITAQGQSRLGPFNGSMGLFSPKGGPTRLQIQFLRVWQTDITGGVTLGNGGVSGDLALKGGGLDGTIHLAPQDGGQMVKALILARNARFGGDTPLAIGNAKIDVDGLFAKGNSTLTANVSAQGLAAGKIFIGQMAASAALVNGSGSVTASIAGRRGTQFALQGTAAFEPDKIVAYVAGNYAGRTVDMPRRMVMEREGEGWKLEPTQVTFGRGIVIAEGHILGGPTKIDLKVARMPLSVLDIAFADLGMGGLASGLIDYSDDGTGAPQGHVAIQVRNFSRSGLVLTSHPVDLYLVGQLDAAALQTRAVVKDQGAVRGRLQAAISDMPRGGTLPERLRGGKLNAQVRYSGPAEALWRLAAVEAFDFTGPLGAVANVTGTIDAPVLTGALAAKGLRVRSSLIGADIQNVEATGSFDASHLSLQRFAGTTGNGGKVEGSGTIDLSAVATKGWGSTCGSPPTMPS